MSLGILSSWITLFAITAAVYVELTSLSRALARYSSRWKLEYFTLEGMFLVRDRKDLTS